MKRLLATIILLFPTFVNAAQFVATNQTGTVSVHLDTVKACTSKTVLHIFKEQYPDYDVGQLKGGYSIVEGKRRELCWAPVGEGTIGILDDTGIAGIFEASLFSEEVAI